MAEEIKIVAAPRTVVGKKVKQLRRDGLVPAVIYGLNAPISIQIEELILRRALRTAGRTNVIDIQMGDENHMVLVREIQRHLTRRELIHIDFLEVDMDALVTAMAEVILTNQEASQPVKDGLGILVQDLRTVEIEAKPAALIDSITVDGIIIEKSNDVIHVSDLVAPDGVSITSDPEMVIARFEIFRAEEVEEVELEEGEEGEGGVEGEEGAEGATESAE